MTSSLSWPAIINAHWSVSALWYTSLIFALLAISVGAQQLWLLPSVSDNARTRFHDDGIRLFRDQLGDMHTGKNATMVFALQCPLMTFALSLACFVGGLLSLILSPLAMRHGWNDEGKVWNVIFVCREDHADPWADSRYVLHLDFIRACHICLLLTHHLSTSGHRSQA